MGKNQRGFGCIMFLLFACLMLSSAIAEDTPSTHLDLRRMQFRTTENVLEELAKHPNLESVVFGKKAMPAKTLDAIEAAYPDLEMEYGFAIGKKTIRSTDETAVINSKIENVDQLIEDLRYLPNLKELENFNTRYTYEQMETISERYPNLHMSCTLHFHDHRVRTDVRAFSTLHSYKSNRHTQEDFLILKYIDNLLALDLGHNAITDLSFLELFPNLRVLILADNQISNLEPIRALKDLEYVELFRNPIENVEPLSGLANLMDLNISYCKITDATALMGLDKLQRLWISQNTWTLPKEQQQMFRERLPNCKFNFNATTGSSGAGWRTHYRYTIVKKIFDTRKYRPFKK